jgi:hypothetical protein
MLLETNYKYEPTLLLFLHVDLFKSPVVLEPWILGFIRFNTTNATNECVYTGIWNYKI